MARDGFKVLMIGVITAVSRVIGQLLIPPGEQSVLAPSVFVTGGSLPLVFSIYSVIAFSLLAAMFRLVEGQLTGSKIWQGLQYGIAYSFIWIVYLWEPLPHAAPLDRLTYPLADTAALLVLGALSGLWLGTEQRGKGPGAAKRLPLVPVMAITGLFMAGRLFQYLVLDIYSSFSLKPWTTIAWSALTGFVIAAVMVWFDQHIRADRAVSRVILLGGLLFGLNLVLFNFYMPLIFDADLPDLMMRTSIDILAVTLGTLSMKQSTRVQTSPAQTLVPRHPADEPLP